METTFKDAYDVLQRHAATLRDQDEPNIDDLLTIVNESVAAYRVCKQRIDAVEKALDEALNGAGLENLRSAKAAGSPGNSLSPPAERQARGLPAASFDGADDAEDDIPF